MRKDHTTPCSSWMLISHKQRQAHWRRWPGGWPRSQPRIDRPPRPGSWHRWYVAPLTRFVLTRIMPQAAFDENLSRYELFDSKTCETVRASIPKAYALVGSLKKRAGKSTSNKRPAPSPATSPEPPRKQLWSKAFAPLTVRLKPVPYVLVSSKRESVADTADTEVNEIFDSDDTAENMSPTQERWTTRSQRADLHEDQDGFHSMTAASVVDGEVAPVPLALA